MLTHTVVVVVVLGGVGDVLDIYIVTNVTGEGVGIPFPFEAEASLLFPLLHSTPWSQRQRPV